MLGLSWLELVHFHGEIWRISINQSTRVVLVKLLEGSSSVATALSCRVRGDPHYPDTVKLAKFIVLKLFAHRPWDKVPTRSDAPFHLFSNLNLADFTLKSDLNRDQDIGQLPIFSRFLKVAQKYKNLMRWSIRQHLEVIRRVFVMARNKDCHELGEEGLRAAVIAEKCVSVHVVQVTVGRVGEAPLEAV